MEPGIFIDERFDVALVGQEDKLACVCRQRRLADHLWRHNCTVFKRDNLPRGQHLEVLLGLASEFGGLFWEELAARLHRHADKGVDFFARVSR